MDKTNISEMKTDSIMSVYSVLEYEEKMRIKRYAKILSDGCSRLSENGAIELLGKIGMLLAEKGKGNG